MKIRIKRFDKSIPLPTYKSEGAVCMDLYSRVDVTIPSHEVGYIPLNVAIEVPRDFWVLLAARTSTHKHGVMPVHGIGIGDWDFRGDNDEYLFPVLNFTKGNVTIQKGLRIAQFQVLRVERLELEEVEYFRYSDRGSFGSTGYIN